MELKEIKCKNCNATLEVKERQKTVTCEYCNAKFSIEDEYNKAYDSTKGALDAQRDALRENGTDGVLKGFFGAQAAVTVIVIIVFIAMIILMISSFIVDRKKIYSYDKTVITSATTSSEVTTTTTTGYSEIEIRSFNSTLELYAGKHYGMSVSNLCDDIVTINKTKGHIVTVSYNGVEGDDEATINSIRDSLGTMTQYNVSFDYDDNGFIYKATITVI